jgi:hypothetical protein
MKISRVLLLTYNAFCIVSLGLIGLSSLSLLRG